MRAQLALARARREILIGLLRGNSRHDTFNTDLIVEFLPVKDQGRGWIVVQLVRLATVIVGKEDEAVFVHLLQQHHARRWFAVGTHRGDRHSFSKRNTWSASAI